MDASASPLCYTLVSHYVVRDIVVVMRTNYGDREGEKRGMYLESAFSRWTVVVRLVLGLVYYVRPSFCTLKVH